MKIGIDARIFGVRETGLGRYTQELINNLLRIDKKNNYVLFVRKEEQLTIKQSNNLTIVQADFPHYSFGEQIFMPPVLSKAKCHLVHFPHFNVPILYFRPFVVTIHDLIKHEYRGMATTTRNPGFYWLKYVFYLLVVWRAVKRARKIIVPSNWVKEKLVKKYRVDPEKIVVTYEGISEKFRMEKLQHRNTEETETQKILGKYKIKKPYLIYVGSVYPHKNVERLIEAVKIVNRSLVISHQSSVILVIVCAHSVFWERLKEKIKRLGAQKYVYLVGFVPDKDLVILYQNALAFVSCSLSEGFGLPGIEAMTVGTPVVCSDIPVFKEIYGKPATYFNPYSSGDIARKILEVLSFDAMAHQSRVRAGLRRAKQFSWKKCAEETLEVYEEVLGGR